MTPSASILQVVDRINELCPSFGGRVSFARSMAQIKYTSMPECWVHYGEESAAPNQTIDKTTQVRNRQFGVMIAVHHSTGITDDPLRDVRDEVDNALLSWEISPMQSAWPCQWVSGEPLEAVDAGVAWRDTWEFSELLRST